MKNKKVELYCVSRTPRDIKEKYSKKPE